MNDVPELYCNNCGHRNAEGSNFCSSCGAPLDVVRDESRVPIIGVATWQIVLC